MKNKSVNTPVHTVRFGHIQAAIWPTKTDKGIFYNTTITRSYKDGDKFENTSSFGRDDLLLVAKVADEAHTWVCGQIAKDRAE